MSRISSIQLIPFVLLFLASCSEGDDPAPDNILGCGDYSTSGQIVLSNDPDKEVDYIVTCLMDVNAQLEIEAGTVIEFKEGAGWSVSGTGSVSAQGTVTDPVIMRSTSGNKGSWAGIIFYTSSANNNLQFVEISDGGGFQFNSNNDRGNIVVYSGGRVTLESCKVSNSASFGLNVAYSTSEASLINNSFTQNKIPVNVNGSRIGIPNSSNDYTGNDEDYIQVTLSGNGVESPTIMQNINVPYRLVKGTSDNLGVRGQLEIDPGVIIEVGDALEIKVNQNGSLKAVGTVSDSIIFRGAEPLSGYWKSIFFTASQSANNQIRYAVIQDAGNAPAITKGAILMGSLPVLSVKNSTFRNIASCAIHHLSNMDNPNAVIEDNTFINVAGGDICHD